MSGNKPAAKKSCSSSSGQQPKPGVSRQHRISDEGLQRLQKQLSSGVSISQQVLAQWVRRYGDAARNIIEANGISVPDID